MLIRTEQQYQRIIAECSRNPKFIIYPEELVETIGNIFSGFYDTEQLKRRNQIAKIIMKIGDNYNWSYQNGIYQDIIFSVIKNLSIEGRLLTPGEAKDITYMINQSKTADTIYQFTAGVKNNFLRKVK